MVEFYCLILCMYVLTGITVAIKPSWAKTPYTKMVKLSIEGDSVKCGGTVCQSDPRPEEVSCIEHYEA